MRRPLIRNLTPMFWRRGGPHLARALRRFSEVEADSGWQALQFLYASDSAVLRARLFEVALEEVAHARMFRAVARLVHEFPAEETILTRRESLYSERAGIAAALADLQVNETAVYKEFEDYARATDDQRVIEIFASIREDESHHGKCADSLLAEVLPDARARRSALRRARLRRAWRNYNVAAKAFSGGVMCLLLWISFFGLGLFGGTVHGRRDETGTDENRGEVAGDSLGTTG